MSAADQGDVRTARVIEFARTGGPEVLQIVERKVVVPGADAYARMAGNEQVGKIVVEVA